MRNIILRGHYDLPKVDATGNGIKDNASVIEWSLYDFNDGRVRFTMSATIWNRLGTDCIQAGQCLDEIRRLYRFNPLVKEMVEVWKLWHLNDMNAGTPRQEAYLKGYRQAFLDTHNHEMDSWSYDTRLDILEKAGLSPDPHHENYVYGTAWLHTVLPQDVIDKVKSWMERT